MRDTESREYRFALHIEYAGEDWDLEMSKRLANSLSDIFEVDAIADYGATKVTITRRQKRSFKR